MNLIGLYKSRKGKEYKKDKSGDSYNHTKMTNTSGTLRARVKRLSMHTHKWLTHKVFLHGYAASLTSLTHCITHKEIIS